MGNPLPPTTCVGTIGELFVQLRLLEYGIQAAPPIKDSGNDFVAIKGDVVKFIQVKTSKNKIPHLSIGELRLHSGRSAGDALHFGFGIEIDLELFQHLFLWHNVLKTTS